MLLKCFAPVIDPGGLVIHLHRLIIHLDRLIVRPRRLVIHPCRLVVHPYRLVIHPRGLVINPYRLTFHPAGLVIETVVLFIGTRLSNANSLTGTAGFEVFFNLFNGEVLAPCLHIAYILGETLELIGHILLGLLVADSFLLKFIVKLFSHV